MEPNKDANYTALCQIERSMKNEIASLSMSNTRLLNYLNSMESSAMPINGTLKALSLLASSDEKMREPDSAEMVRAWMHSLERASHQPLRRLMFKTVVFNQPVFDEFKDECSLNTVLDEMESQDAWKAVLLGALASGLMVALCVFGLHLNFYFSLVLFLCLYLLILAYYFFWLQPRLEIRRLKLLTKPMTPFVQSFVRSIKVANYGLIPDRHSLRKIWRTLRHPSSEKSAKPSRRAGSASKARPSSVRAVQTAASQTAVKKKTARRRTSKPVRPAAAVVPVEAKQRYMADYFEDRIVLDAPEETPVPAASLLAAPAASSASASSSSVSSPRRSVHRAAPDRRHEATWTASGKASDSRRRSFRIDLNEEDFQSGKSSLDGLADSMLASLSKPTVTF